jgi:hypothetical protein
MQRVPETPQRPTQNTGPIPNLQRLKEHPMLTLTVILSVATVFFPDLSNKQWAVLMGVCLLVALFPSFFLALVLIAGAVYFSTSR